MTNKSLPMPIKVKPYLHQQQAFDCSFSGGSEHKVRGTNNHRLCRNGIKLVK